MANSSSFDYRTQLANINTSFQNKWANLLEQPDRGHWNAFTFLMNTEGGASVDLSFFGPSPHVEEFSGAKKYKAMRSYSYSLTATMKAGSLELDGIDVRSDKGGVIGARLDTFGQKTMSAHDKLVTESLVSSSGAGPTGYDGVALISDSHPHGPSSGTQDNKTTAALSALTYDSGTVAMQEFRDENGEPLHYSPTHLMVGPKNAKLARQIAQADERIVPINASGVEASSTVIAAATIPNVFRGEVDVVINPRLVGSQDDYWYLMDLSQGDRKPMVWAELRAPELIPQTDPDSPERFDRDVYRWSIELDGVAGAGAWQTIYGGIL